MSLYEDISPKGLPEIKRLEQAGINSQQLQLLKSELLAKKVSALRKDKKKPTVQLTPAVDLKKSTSSSTTGGPVHFNPQTGKIEQQTSSLLLSDAAACTFLRVEDEYDPLRPNDYEDVLKRKRLKDVEIKRQRAEEGKGKENLERRRRESDESSGSGSSDDERERSNHRRNDRAGAAIAPPKELMEDDPKPAGDESKGPACTFGGSAVASKIMAKMGYRQGSGLGRQEQGMSTALQVEKTGRRAGKIIHERDLPGDTGSAGAKKGEFLMPPPPAQPQPAAGAEPGAMGPPKSDLPSTQELLKAPTKVVLLRNMVGPGQVDDDLQPEVQDECGKYGKVIKCLIFEMPNEVAEEAVRIFIEFEKLDAAIKALIDLNGRYFGGRAVRACFYDVDKFRRFELADGVSR